MPRIQVDITSFIFFNFVFADARELCQDSVSHTPTRVGRSGFKLRQEACLAPEALGLTGLVVGEPPAPKLPRMRVKWQYGLPLGPVPRPDALDALHCPLPLAP